jgi:hypothetical protein
MAGTENRDWDPSPLLVTFPDTAQAAETYGFAGGSGTIHLEGQLFRPGAWTRNGLYFHASQFDAAADADAGRAGRCRHGRHLRSQPLPKDDRALIMEKLLIEVGTWVRHAVEALEVFEMQLAGSK